MSLISARDLIKKSLKLTGVAAEGETPTAEMMNDGLDSLNLLLNLWGSQNLMTLSAIQESFALTALQASYTMGITSVALVTDFNTTKPHRIISAFVRDALGNDTDIAMIPMDQYNGFSLKTTGGRPDRLAQDPGATQQTNQVMTIYLYPVPDASTTYTLYLFSEKPLTHITALDDVIDMVDPYITAIAYNLPEFIAPEYGRILHPKVEKIADESKKTIETINAKQKRKLADLNLPVPEASDWTRGS